MLDLILGSGLAVAALLFVLWPLVRGGAVAHQAAAAAVPAREATALEALREIEFDQATGKLSPEDYATLKARYAPQALAELKAREAAGTVAEAVADAVGDAAPAPPAAHAMRAGDEAAERLIARMRQRSTTCPTHGARPEPDALYCSDCGTYLASACLHCGAPVEGTGARFCGSCGNALAA